MIDNKYPEGERGDVLIFMSGIKEITTIVDACKEYAEKNQVGVKPLQWMIKIRTFTIRKLEIQKCLKFGLKPAWFQTTFSEQKPTLLNQMLI